jgi:hypothetical protein
VEGHNLLAITVSDRKIWWNGYLEIGPQEVTIVLAGGLLDDGAHNFGKLM